MRFSLSILLLFVIPFTIQLNGQNAVLNDTANYPYWADMMQQPRANFAAVQRAFNIYWKDRPITKGCGWKPFKRWEHYWQYRLDSNGNLPAADEVWKSYFRVKDEENHNPLEQKSESDIQYKGNEGNWQPLGPDFLPSNKSGQPNGLGRVAAIAFHPTDSNKIYVGAPAGGLWISKDYGKTWKTTTDSLPTLGVSAIAINPSSPNIIYIGTGDRDNSDSYGYGMLKSTDGGETWYVSNNGMGSLTVSKLLINPNTPSTLLAATSNGIYISTNAGNSWTKKSITSNFKDIAYKPGDYNTVYATESGKFYLSTDGGNSFTKITSGLQAGFRGVIGVTPNAPDYVYFLQASSNVFKALYISTNSGVSFTTQSTTPNILAYEADGSGTGGQGWYDLCIAVDPNDKDAVYAGGINIFKSRDGGATWYIKAHWTGSGGGAPVHADQHVLEYSPVTKNLYAGNDGGIYYTTDTGSTWNNISSGIANGQVYRMGQSTLQRREIITGYQDNGTAYYNGVWSTIRGGDGMECIVDYSDTSVTISSLYYGDFARHKNGKYEGNFAVNGKLGITETGGWITPIIQHNTDPNIFFVGYKNIWRTNNGKDSIQNINWAKISNNLAGSSSSDITALEQCIKNPDVLYISRSDSKFFRSDDINATSPTYTDLTSKLPMNYVPACIETTPYNANRVYIGIDKKIYRSDNKGNSWTDITANIPNLRINTIVVDTSTNLEEIYVGTDVGVYYKNLTMTNWIYFNKGLPLSVNVNELEIFYNPRNITNSKLRAATYGRGIWETDLHKEGTEKPVVDFITDKTEVCLKSVVNFEDNTGNIPLGWKWSFSPSNVTYINGTNDTSQNVSVRMNAAGNYTVTLIASNANGTDSFKQLGSVYVYDTARHMCITPNASAGGFGIGIYNVKVANINNPSEGFDQNGSYEDYTCSKIVKLKPDSTYALEVITGGNNNEFVKVFIDYNSDGDFKDPNELIFDGPSVYQSHTGNFTAPKNPALNKLLRMRVISDFSAIGLPDCPALDYGQSEDYNVFFDVPNVIYNVNTDSICAGDSVTINVSTYGKVNGLVWDFGAGAVPQTAKGAGPFTVYYTTAGYKEITKIFNGVAPETKDSIVFVGEVPTVGFFAHDTLQCIVSRSINYVNNTSISAGTLVYKWDFGDSTTATATNNFKQYSAPGNYTVWLKATGVTGCSDSVSTSVKVSNSGINSSFKVDTNAMCLGDNVFKFTNTTTPPSGVTVNYDWHFGDLATGSSVDTISHAYNAAGTYEVKLLVASTQGCKDSATRTVSVYEYPVANFVILPPAICLGDTLQLTNNSSISTGSLNYRWNFGNADSSTSINPKEVYKTAGIFNIKLIAISDKGCSDDTTQTVFVYVKPQATFTKQYLSNSAVKFSSVISGFPHYHWEFGDGDTLTGVNPTHQYKTKGTYNVTLDVINSQGCRNIYTDTVTIYNTAVSNITNVIDALSVQPNPFENSFEVSFYHNSNTTVKVYLTDVLGRKILDVFNESNVKEEFKGTAETGNLAKGVYFVVVEAGNTKQAVKVIK